MGGKGGKEGGAGLVRGGQQSTVTALPQMGRTRNAGSYRRHMATSLAYRLAGANRARSGRGATKRTACSLDETAVVPAVHVFPAEAWLLRVPGGQVGALGPCPLELHHVGYWEAGRENNNRKG